MILAHEQCFFFQIYSLNARQKTNMEEILLAINNNNQWSAHEPAKHHRWTLIEWNPLDKWPVVQQAKHFPKQ